MSDVSLDIRIFGVPERMEWIERNKAILGLPDDRIVIDEAHDGCVPTAKKAWMIPSTATHVIVLPDDVELCDGFINYCKRIATVQYDKVVSFFPIQFLSASSVRRIPIESPYISTSSISGAGIMMRSDYVKPCIESWPENARDDDGSIRQWAIANGIDVITTIPSIVQHIGDDSIVDATRKIGRTVFYDPNPVDVNWDNGYVTSWTNIKRR